MRMNWRFHSFKGGIGCVPIERTCNGLGLNAGRHDMSVAHHLTEEQSPVRTACQNFQG